MLYENWSRSQEKTPLRILTPSNQVRPTGLSREEIRARPERPRVLEGADEDRPPVVDICVGREKELDEISTSKAKVVFVTGIGGQGKSTLAARYFSKAQSDHAFAFYVWQDCKEESERFENQLASVTKSFRTEPFLLTT